MHVPKREDSEYTLSAKDAASILDVAVSTLTRHADQGRIDHIRKGISRRPRYRFHPDDINSLKSEWSQRKVATEPTREPEPKANPEPVYVDDTANPVAADFIANNRKRLEKKGWTEDDFEELMSWYGDGGALTDEGVADRVKRIEWKIGIRKQVEALLESQQAESFAAMVTALYKESIKQQERPPARQSGKPS